MPGLAARSPEAGATAPLEAPESSEAGAVLAALGTGVEGLAPAEVEGRRLASGPNLVPVRRRTGALAVLGHQLRSPVVVLLAAAAALAVGFNEAEEAIAIGVVLLLNTLIGFSTEIRAVRSIEALRALGAPSARVRRAGATLVVPAETLVPGDIVLLEAGDAVPADLRIVEASRLAADESTLTGESEPVEKTRAPVAPGTRLADRRSMLFRGSAVVRGAGAGVVVAIGAATALGTIARLVSETEAAPSPLERQLARLSGQLVWTTLAIAAVIAAVGLATGRDAFLIVEAAIALGVAAVPEGLPVVATLVLARGMWRMARRHALIERLSAVETLGATTLILTDKTGTLTENRMRVERIVIASGEVAPEAATGAAANPVLARLLEVAVLCGTATLGPDGAGGSGDPMELALLRAGRLAGLERAALLARCPLRRVHAFETATRMMATVHAAGAADRWFVAVKGAPEAVLAAASRVLEEAGPVALDDARRAQWLARIDELGRHGLRVIACAGRTVASPDAPPYGELTLYGLVGLEDPARPDVPAAIAACRRAGIRVVMVTGDHAVTARSIARAVGLGAARVVEGAGLAAPGPGDILDADVFARVDPSEKLALVRAYQGRGEVVAMTGDGVNDAPALRQADIGIAMGLRGTDVAREAAAMVLLDDAFPTIVNAIREGRVIFGNIRRFVFYLLSCNLSEVLVVSVAILTALPLPLLPLQILYLNLVTDVFPAFALALGEGEADVMGRPPRDPRRPIVGGPDWGGILLQSLALMAATFGAMGLALGTGLGNGEIVTVTFLTLAFAQLWHVFDMRASRSRLLRNEVTANRWVWLALGLCSLLLVVPCYWPALGAVLGVVRPSAGMWGIVLAMSLAPLVLIEGLVVARAALWRGRAG